MIWFVWYTFLYSRRRRLLLWNQVSCLGVTWNTALHVRLSATPLHTCEEEEKKTHRYNNNNCNNTQPGRRRSRFTTSHTHGGSKQHEPRFFYPGKWKEKNLGVLGNKLVPRDTSMPLKCDQNFRWTNERRQKQWRVATAGIWTDSSQRARQSDGEGERERCSCCHSLANLSASYCYADDKSRVADGPSPLSARTDQIKQSTCHLELHAVDLWTTS